MLTLGICDGDMTNASRRRLLQTCITATLSRWTADSSASQGATSPAAAGAGGDSTAANRLDGMTSRKTQFHSARGGRRVCFAEWGQANGTPVILLHGGPGCRLGVSAPTETLLRELGIRLITYDRPGYGQSTRRGPLTSVVDHVEDVRAIADWLGIASFAVTGGSGGAPHALAVAARLPDRVIRVSNWGALAPFDVLGLDEYQREQDADTREYLADVRKSEAACTALFEKLDTEARAAITADSPGREATLEQTRQGVAGWVDDERALQRPWGFGAAEVHVPTVIYSNPKDTTAPPNHARWLVAQIPKAVLVSSTSALSHAAIEDATRARRGYFTWLLQGGDPARP